MCLPGGSTFFFFFTKLPPQLLCQICWESSRIQVSPTLCLTHNRCSTIFISFPWSQGNPNSIVGLVSTSKALNSRNTNYAKALDMILINCSLLVRAESLSPFVTVGPVWLLSCLCFFPRALQIHLKDI